MYKFVLASRLFVRPIDVPCQVQNSFLPAYCYGSGSMFTNIELSVPETKSSFVCPCLGGQFQYNVSHMIEKT